MRTKLFFMIFVATSFCCNLTFGQSQADEVKRFIARAETAYSMGEFQDALEEYQKAQKLVPNYPDLYKAIGDVYEKLGSDKDLQAAIESLNQYLKLSPQAKDKDEIKRKIASLEYRLEKQLKQTKILDDLSGIWVSDWVTEDNTAFSTSQYKDYKDKPYVILEIKEIQKTGNYRVTLLPHSRMYGETIINKTVNITLKKDNFFRFIYADSKVHNPSSATYNGLRLFLGATGGSDTFKDLGNVAIDLAQEMDLPSNTETLYDFDLKYNNGKLTGLLNIKGKHVAQSGAGTIQSNQDQLYEITFTKNNEYFNFTDNPFLQIEKGTLYLTNNMGHRRAVTGANKKELLNDPKFKNIKSAYNLQDAGIIMTGAGLGAILAGGFWKLKAKGNVENTVGNFLMIGGVVTTVIGIPICFAGNEKIKKAIDEYNNSFYRKNDHSYNFKIGITPSGMVGFAYTF